MKHIQISKLNHFAKYFYKEFPLYDSSHRQDFLVRSVSNFNSACRRAGMYNLPIAYIYPYVSCIAHNIPRLRLRIRNACPRTSQRIRCSWNAISKILVYSPHKTGAVCTICQAGTSRHIGITNELTGIIGNLLSFAS